MTDSLAPLAGMTGTVGLDDLSDADLLSAIRSGNPAATTVLYTRHRDAVTRFVRQREFNVSNVDDLVSEAFARLLEQLDAGKGPTLSVRQYLYVTVRNEVNDRISAPIQEIPVADENLDVGGAGPIDEMLETEFESTTFQAAFSALPERWQEVLWYSEVEGLRPRQLEGILGVKSHVVSVLLSRAKAGLARAYLEAYLAAELPERCREFTPALASRVRREPRRRMNARTEDHLNTCPHCSAMVTNSRHLATALRTIVAPTILGGTATASALGWTASTSSAPVVAAFFAAPLGKVTAGAALALALTGGVLIAQSVVPTAAPAVTPAAAPTPTSVGPSETAEPPVTTAPAPEAETTDAQSPVTAPVPGAEAQATGGGAAAPQPEPVPAPAVPASNAYTLGAPTSVPTGGQASVSVSVTNEGASASGSLRFGATLNRNAAFPEGVVTIAAGAVTWTCARTTTSVQCDATGLAPGASSTLNLDIRAIGAAGSTVSVGLTPVGTDLAAGSDAGTVHQRLIVITS